MTHEMAKINSQKTPEQRARSYEHLVKSKILRQLDTGGYARCTGQLPGLFRLPAQLAASSMYAAPPNQRYEGEKL